MKYIRALRRLLVNSDRLNDLVAVSKDIRLAIDNLTQKLNAGTNSQEEQKMGKLQNNIDDIFGELKQKVARLVEIELGAREEPAAGPDIVFKPVADIELIERFALDWPHHSHIYRLEFRGLRRAAQRLLPILESSAGDQYGLSDKTMQRLREVGEQVACLARLPLYFPEMFHGVSLLPDGTFEPLDESVSQHLRASGLLGPEDRTAINEIYERLSQRCRSPLRIVEIGSAAGRGSTKIAGEYVKRSGGTLYCVDPWDGLLYFGFLANMRIFEFEGTVVPIRSSSIEAAALFDDGSLDAVFVDGSHIYRYVLADIDAYVPKIRKNGLLFGHDLHDVPSRFDRNELLNVADKNNIEVNYKNANGDLERVDVHPGVILAVQDRFGDDVERFPGSVVWAKQV
jgi:predicted O-methyltransferase YrrM